MKALLTSLICCLSLTIVLGQSEGIPQWFLEEMSTETGTWIANNSEYQSEQETFDHYAITWAWSTSNKTLIGRLYGLTNGVASEPFWEFRKYWDAKEQRGIVAQYGIDGTVGIGRLFNKEDGILELIQVFTNPDGTQYRSGHRNKRIDDYTMEGSSYGISDQNDWTKIRTYTWRKKK